MSDDLNNRTTNSTDTEDGSQGAARIESRRRMLKAAAVSVPLIASLKSGAAFAVASANMCIVKNSNNPPSDVFVTTTDSWVRRPVTRYTFENADGSITLLKYDIDGIHGGFWQFTASYYESDGLPWVNGGELAVHDEEVVHVLVYYQPSSDLMSVGEVGPAPKFQLDTSRGQTALSTSCLCSVNPDNPVCIV